MPEEAVTLGPEQMPSMLCRRPREKFLRLPRHSVPIRPVCFREPIDKRMDESQRLARLRELEWSKRWAFLLHIQEATAALPANLDHFAIFNQYRHAALSRCQFTQAVKRRGVGFDVVFDIFATLPFQPIAHFLSMGAARCAEKFKPGHGSAPPGFRG